MKTALITGANRGLGLEFARQYLAEGWRVIACCRKPEGAAELNALNGSCSIDIRKLDVSDFSTIDRLAQNLSGEAIDLLINNAGIYPDFDHRGFGESDYDAWAQAFRINAMAPLRMTEAFLEHVSHSTEKKIAFVTSKMGSLDDNTSGGCYAYRSSKAALNMVVKSLSLDLASRGIISVLLHPGWARTDMGGPNAWISAQESVSGMRRIIEQATHRNSGVFTAYDGKVINW